jgi:hypothetical protein
VHVVHVVHVETAADSTISMEMRFRKHIQIECADLLGAFAKEHRFIDSMSPRDTASITMHKPELTRPAVSRGSSVS